MRKPSESYLKLKKATDKILSGAGLVILSPVFAGIAIAIKLEDGITAPVFFKQKRVGIHKSHFMLYKFRSMQTDTPHDMPTHLLTDPEQYLTGTGSRLSTKEQKNLQRNGNTAFCGVFFLPIFRFCPYYGYQHV